MFHHYSLKALRVIIVFRSKSLASALFARLLLWPTQVTSWLKERRIHTCCALTASSALGFVVSLVKIIIERSFVPQVPFEKFSTVTRGERPDRNEVYEVVVRFKCAEVLKSLAIGLPLSRTNKKRDGLCPSVSNGVDPPTFYTLCKHFNEFF